MTHKPASSLSCLALAALAAVTTGGCTLDRSVIPAWGNVTPSRICPGDTVTVAWDFLGTETCRNETLCAMYHPTVQVSSSGMAFPPRTVTGYRDSFTFNPTAENTYVDFGIDRSEVRVPTTRTDAEGRSIDAVRGGLTNYAILVERFPDGQETELVHDGMCAGSTPVNSAESLPGPPRNSPNLRLVSLCNRNGVPVVVTLNGSDPGSTYSQTLAPGDCVDTDAPGMPSSLAFSRVVDVRPVFTDPGVHCSATGPNSLPPTLRTVAVMACR